MSDEELDLRDRIEALERRDREYVFGWLVNAALATVEGRRELEQAMDAGHVSDLSRRRSSRSCCVPSSHTGTQHPAVPG